MCDVLHCWNIVCVILRYVSYALKVVSTVLMCHVLRSWTIVCVIPSDIVYVLSGIHMAKSESSPPFSMSYGS